MIVTGSNRCCCIEKPQLFSLFNILLFVQDIVTISVEEIFLAQHFASFGSNKYDHECLGLFNPIFGHI